jgi:aminopeptidase N
MKKHFFTLLGLFSGFLWIEMATAQSGSSLEQIFEKEALFHSKGAHSIQLATPANGLNIDVKYYKCFWYINPANDSIMGKVSIVFTPKDQAVNQFTLDLANNMVVENARFRGQTVSTSFTAASTLQINLGTQSLLPGQLDSLVIRYRGKPIPSPFGSFSRTLHAGVPVIYTLSEPYGAKDWWPCKQALSDKADSIDITLYTPAPNVAVANGLLKKQTEANGIRSYFWKHKYSIVTYLIAIAVTNYAHFQYKAVLSSGDSLPIENYSYPENLAQWQTEMAPIVPMMQDFDTLVSPYPFSKERYAHVQFAFGGGMEHQTISFMQNTNLGLQAHELIHHWFGNKITCGSWQDIWLNEGFATYFAALVYVRLGLSSWPQESQQWINLITQQPGGSVFCSDTTDLYRIFSGRLSYGKGAMLLHMLRWEMGDAAFWTALRNFIRDPDLIWGFAKTPDLVAHLEAACGKNLTEFFNDWYKGEGFPNITGTATKNGNLLEVHLSQTSSHPSVSFFEMNIPVKVSGNGWDTIVVLPFSSNGQNFSFAFSGPINTVLFDPDKKYLARYTISQITGNGTPIAFPELELYPNPGQDKIQLLGLDENTHLFILDAKGKIWKKIPFEGQQDALDVTSLSQGVYFFHFQSSKGAKIKKWIKN